MGKARSAANIRMETDVTKKSRIVQREEHNARLFGTPLI
jgi:hypothetical protein